MQESKYNKRLKLAIRDCGFQYLDGRVYKQGVFSSALQPVGYRCNSLFAACEMLMPRVGEEERAILRRALKSNQ